MYTVEDIRKIHNVFGHPSVKATQKMLRREKVGSLGRTTRASVEQISEDCKICRLSAAKPRRLKLTVGMDGLRFNEGVKVDTMFIKGRPIIHMMDQATHFSAATFLNNQKSA